MDNKALIHNFNNGKEKALRQLYDCFFEPLCAYAYHYIHNKSAVEDIVQEIFIKLWDRRQNFPSIYAIRSFLYTSVRNACLNEIRQQAKTRHTQLQEEDATQDNEWIIEEEVHRMIQQEIMQLPNAMRKVFELTLLDMSIADIATALNVSENTVRNQRVSARKKLQEKLNGWLFLLFL